MYLLRCRDFQVVYVSETGRFFGTRIKEHTSAFINNNFIKSAFAQHILEEKHHSDDPLLFHNENRFRPRLALETIEMFWSSGKFESPGDHLERHILQGNFNHSPQASLRDKNIKKSWLPRSIFFSCQPNISVQPEGCYHKTREERHL